MDVKHSSRDTTCIKIQKPLKSRFNFPAGERLREQKCGVGCWNKPVMQWLDLQMCLVPQLRMLKASISRHTSDLREFIMRKDIHPDYQEVLFHDTGRPRLFFVGDSEFRFTFASHLKFVCICGVVFGVKLYFY